MDFASALTLAQEARVIELADQRHFVAQHPLNRYPQDHPLYFPVPPRPDVVRGQRLRAEANEFFREWFSRPWEPLRGRPGPCDPYNPQVGEEFVWRMNGVDYVPVVCACVKESGSIWFERLDEPVPVSHGAPLRKPWYRARDPLDLRPGRESP